MITDFKLFESDGDNIIIGELVIVDSRVGLVVSDEYRDEEYDDYVIDVLFRMDNGAISEVDISDIENASYSDLEDHISAYVSIAKREGYLINIPEEYADDYPKEYAEYDGKYKKHLEEVQRKKNLEKYKI